MWDAPHMWELRGPDANGMVRLAVKGFGQLQGDDDAQVLSHAGSGHIGHGCHLHDDRAGCRAVLLDVGNETEWRLSRLRVPDGRCADLGEAAEFIIARSSPLEAEA